MQGRLLWPSVTGYISILNNYAAVSKYYHGFYKRPSCYGESLQIAKGAKARGVKVIIAGAGMAAALPGVIAASTPLPVIGVPIKGMLDGLDAMLSIIQMPPGIPVATVGVNGAQNAAILAAEMIALGDAEIAKKVDAWKAGLGKKIEKANADLAAIKDYKFKC